MREELTDRAARLAEAIPFYGPGEPIPRDRDLSIKDDKTPFKAVLHLLLRSWPYLKPQVAGNWWIPGKGIEPQSAELLSGRGYTFRYVAPLVTLLALIPAFLGLVPVTGGFANNAFYALVAIIVGSVWVLSYTSGKQQGVALVLLTFAIVTANLTALIFFEGASQSIYIGTLSAACMSGWFIQLRLETDGLAFRFRIRTHLIYYYSAMLIVNLVYVLLGLLLAEVINQSLLQNEALMPGLAALLGYPDFSVEAVTMLTEAQRMELRWAPIKIEFAFFLLLWPLELGLLYYVLWIFQQVNQDLRLDLVERWHQLSLQHHADHRVGDSIWRIQTDSEAVTDVLKIIGELSLIILNVASALLMISILSPVVGLIAAFVVLPLLALARWAMPRVRVRSLVQRMANADLTSRVQESFRSIKLNKSYGISAQSQAQFEDDSSIAFNTEYHQTRLDLRVSLVSDTYSQLFIFFGLGLMALWAYEGQATFANELVALLGLSFTVWNLSAFQWGRERHELTITLMGEALLIWGYVQQVAMGLKRVFDILDLEPSITESENAIPLVGVRQRIQFHDVEFSYEPPNLVLKGVNLQAAPGSIVAIVGPSGAGKSTLVSLLLRLFDPDKGSISIDGRDLRDYSISSLRQNIAIALQENLLFGTTVRENIVYAAPNKEDEAVADALEIACLNEIVDQLPEGLNTSLGDRGARLSTGQKQRISIARAVLRDAQILILDEPTSSLDAETEQKVLENLRAWAQTAKRPKRTIFLITHRLSTIRHADSIAYLHSGTIAEHGEHDTLMQIEGGRYRSFVAAESSNFQQGLGDA